MEELPGTVGFSGVGGHAPARAVGLQVRPRLLIVDDEAAVAEGLRLLLRREYTVEVAASGELALSVLAGREDFDLVLCDLMMPRMSGIALFEHLGTVAPRYQSKLVFMTGGAFTPEAEAFLAEVCNPRVQKPFDIASLQAVLRTARMESGAD